jgi:hypothetical protein
MLVNWEIHVCFMYITEMVRTYVRKSNRQSWSMENLQAAVNDVKSNNMSLRKAAAAYGVPYITIRRHVHGLVKTPGKLGRFKTVLDDVFEQELAKYVTDMQQRFYGLSAIQFRRLAYDLAVKNKLNHPFNVEKGTAGKDWIAGFLRRHPNISFRTPETTSLSRATGFNQVQVQRFFTNLRTVLEEEKITAHHIYNVDETGISTVQTPGRILAAKGSKQIGKITSAERGQNITAVCVMNAAGVFNVPPAFIFPRKNMTATLLKGAPPGNVGYAVQSGWMDSQTFITWLQHFQQHVNATVEKKVLLLLDNHASHRTLEVVDYARLHGIVILSLPPHTSHKLQPLDRTFFGPLKRYYSQACDHWLVANPGKRITPYDVAPLFAEAYGKCATIPNAVSGFACSGIFPYNPDISCEADYAPSTVTDNAADYAPIPSTSVLPSLPSMQNSQLEASSQNIVLTEVTGSHGSSLDTSASGRPMHQDDTLMVQLESEAAASEVSITGVFVESGIPHSITVCHPATVNVEFISELELEPSIRPTDVNITPPQQTTPEAKKTNCKAMETATSNPTPSCSTTNRPMRATNRISVLDISPLPKAPAAGHQGRKRKAQASEIVTGSPFKASLINKDKECKKQLTKKAAIQKKNQKENDKKTSSGKTKKGKQAMKMRHGQQVKKGLAVENSTDANCLCLVCGENFDGSWVQCSICKEWAHEDCAELTDPLYYYCDNCRK